MAAMETLLGAAIGGVLAIAAGAVTQLLGAGVERRKRRDERSDEAARRVLHTFIDWRARRWVMDEDDGEYEDALWDEHRPGRPDRLTQPDVLLINQRAVRDELLLVLRMIDLHPQLSQPHGMAPRGILAALLDWGQTVAEAAVVGHKLGPRPERIEAYRQQLNSLPPAPR